MQLSVVVEGQYRVLVTIHSFELLESRCAECYDDQNDTTLQRGLCCDGDNAELCPNSCDILIAFNQSQLDTGQFRANHFYAEGILGFNFNASVVQQYNKTSLVGIPTFGLINPLNFTTEESLRPRMNKL